MAPALAADLYVTERRVLFVGRQRVEVQLEEIRDAAVIDDLLLLALDGGRAITIGVSDAPALRAEIARARAGRHAGRDPGTTPSARVHLPVAGEPRE